MKQTHYLEKLLDRNKDIYFAENFEECNKLFKVFYDLEFIKKMYAEYNNHENDHKLTFNLFYGRPGKIQFHSVVFGSDNTARMLLYRNYYGPANDDFVDLVVKFNDFEILEYSHMYPVIKEEIEEKYIKYMAEIYGEEYLTDGKKYFQNKSPQKERSFRQNSKEIVQEKNQTLEK